MIRKVSNETAIVAIERISQWIFQRDKVTKEDREVRNLLFDLANEVLMLQNRDDEEMR